MNKRSMFFMLCVFFLIAGCQTAGVAKPQHNEDFIGFATDIDLEGQKVLINDIWFSFTDETEFTSDTKDSLHKEDLTIGQKVKVKFDGVTDDSFPASASARQFILLTDVKSDKQRDAVKLVVNDPRFSKVVMQSMETNQTGLYSLRFKDLTLNSDVHVLVSIDDERVIVPMPTTVNQ
ncbi:YobA family protein [Rossellomorea aquimaris]|uniref:YobA family protein n=1 Tax=Rossellomorea aquimaris TaxID=189382 RepID=UPI001CD54CB9|nr:YobA family protein [Rossellomorea aquimaris]MCA1054733.1 YobA family protein [Rossellomorea aquimaris]